MADAAGGGLVDFHLTDAADHLQSPDDGEFDAFNDDTFGDAAEEWAESAHEQLAGLTEEEKSALQSSQAFFDLDGQDAEGGWGLLEPLEPVSDTNGGLHHAMDRMRLSPAPKHAPPLQAESSGMNAPSPRPALPMFSSAGHLGTTPPVDPAIMSIGRLPGPVPVLPGPPPQPPRASPMGPPLLPTQGHTLEELEREMLSQSRPPPLPRPTQPSPFGMPPPRFQASGPPFNRGPPPSAEFNNGRFYNQPHPNHPNPMPHHAHQHPNPPSHHHFQPHHQHPPSGPQFNRGGRLPPQYSHPSHGGGYDHRQRSHHNQHFQPPPHHYHPSPNHYHRHQQPHYHHTHHHQPRHHHNHQHHPNDGFHHNEGHGDFRRPNRNPDDDKNSETFGADFVEDHLPHSGRSTGRFNPRGELMTPGHVHVLGILRGARERGDAHQPGESDFYERDQPQLCRDEDEFAGLMTGREKLWIINIQLSQLKCENPFVDDYYYTVFHQKQELAALAQESEGNNNQDDDKENKQLKRDEEGPQLLLKAESTDSGKDEYIPVQFNNSLGKLQAHTVKAPRKNIDVDVVNTEVTEGTSTSQKDARNYKSILMELERIYSHIIEVEDSDKKLAALPTNTDMRRLVSGERLDAVEKVTRALAMEGRLKKYLLVRKGKALLKRCFAWLSDPVIHLICCTLFPLLPLAIKRDREDKLLLQFWPDIKAHFRRTSPEILIQYMTLLNAGGGSGSNSSPIPGSAKTGSSTFKTALAHPLGVSMLASALQLLSERKGSEDEKRSTEEIAAQVGKAVSEMKDIPAPLERIDLNPALFQTPDPQMLGRLAKIGSLVVAT
ncbi:hypothetical protein TCAL_14765 [Tigriopus californicus]|uniref:mRNA decay factor PAT1 domain-containing protein n=1 Tax=Tigriopus californicus TaxID=6832 RepID=A0A553PGI3_TIGCA|nr:protein PAT1 homolog 1-like [Tigriopus californicus]TRY76782.1 hypothetical protein TCAL_14765 [Tigriopus californicus]